MVIGYEQFERVEIRAGTIVAALPFPEARKPAYKLHVDFGAEVGRRWSSAQITALYGAEELIGSQVVAVVNFAPKRIAGFSSEVLILGAPDDAGNVVLLRPDHPVAEGVRVY